MEIHTNHVEVRDTVFFGKSEKWFWILLVIMPAGIFR